MKFKVGDLVRNTHEHRVINPGRPLKNGEDIGIVLEIVGASRADGGAGYPQLKVGTPNGITLWWPSVTEVISEGR